MTTEAASTAGTVVDGDELSALAAIVVGLENRPTAEFRTLSGPATAVQRRAEELGDLELAHRARLLLVNAQLRAGRSEEGGRNAHQVLEWAERHGSPYLLARAHRELANFYRLVGDSSDALTHAVQCVAHLPEDVSSVVRARHLLSLAVALDENGSPDEADRRFKQALALAISINDRDFELYILNNMAYTAYENGDELVAGRLIEQMRDVQAHLSREFSANELDTIARVEMMTRRYAEVEQTLAPVLRFGPSAAVDNEGDALAECLLTLAEARRLDGRPVAAQVALDAAIRMSGDRALHAVSARALEEQAALYAATGRFQDAYNEHRAFHAAATALHSAKRESRARALQAVFEATEARRTTEQFREMAHRDPLTGLYNRRYVNERLPAMLGEAAGRGAPISVAIVDLDHFKVVNDTLSHGTGDTVLQHIALLLTEAATDSAFAARMGGEEFLLVFPDVDAADGARRCERLRLRVHEYSWAPITGSLKVTTSIGVTTVRDGRATQSAVLAQADRNLYAAKRAGRNRVVVDTRG